LYFYGLCRSGTEENYSKLSQLPEDISTYCRDCIEKQIEKERKLKKEKADKNKLSI
jgi:hypothetical protein